MVLAFWLMRCPSQVGVGPAGHSVVSTLVFQRWCFKPVVSHAPATPLAERLIVHVAVQSAHLSLLVLMYTFQLVLQQRCVTSSAP